MSVNPLINPCCAEPQISLLPDNMIDTCLLPDIQAHRDDKVIYKKLANLT